MYIQFIGFEYICKVKQPPPPSNSRAFSSLQKEMYPFPPLPSPWQPPISMDLAILDISGNWSHIICTYCDWLPSLSIMFSKFIHVVTCISTCFLLMAVWYLWIDYILFTHSSADRHLHGCHLLAITNIATWTFLDRFLGGHYVSFFLVTYLGVELLGHMVTV